jgi:hypothetical protein
VHAASVHVQALGIAVDHLGPFVIQQQVKNVMLITALAHSQRSRCCHHKDVQQLLQQQQLGTDSDRSMS